MVNYRFPNGIVLNEENFNILSSLKFSIEERSDRLKDRLISQMFSIDDSTFANISRAEITSYEKRLEKQDDYAENIEYYTHEFKLGNSLPPLNPFWAGGSNRIFGNVSIEYQNIKRDVYEELADEADINRIAAAEVLDYYLNVPPRYETIEVKNNVPLTLLHGAVSESSHLFSTAENTAYVAQFSLGTPITRYFNVELRMYSFETPLPLTLALEKLLNLLTETMKKIYAELVLDCLGFKPPSPEYLDFGAAEISNSPKIVDESYLSSSKSETIRAYVIDLDRDAMEKEKRKKKRDLSDYVKSKCYRSFTISHDQIEELSDLKSKITGASDPAGVLSEYGSRANFIKTWREREFK